VSLETNAFSTPISKRFTLAASRDPEPLGEAVRDALTHYFDQLDNTPPSDLYQLVMQQVEKPLFESVMQYTGGNQSRAATLLGISRSTLRKKLAQFGID
jgi:Fis family transcriptional regulator